LGRAIWHDAEGARRFIGDQLHGSPNPCAKSFSLLPLLVRLLMPSSRNSLLGSWSMRRWRTRQSTTRVMMSLEYWVRFRPPALRSLIVGHNRGTENVGSPAAPPLRSHQLTTADAVHSRPPRQPDPARASRSEFFVRAMSRGCIRRGLIDVREQKSAQP
jgi:hypothetical protein